MKDISTLTEDIYHVLDATQDHTHDPILAEQYSSRIGGEFIKASGKRDEPRAKGKLWASDLGKRCLRQHYYNFNEPHYGEKLNGNTKFKFLYGNVLEEAVLYFAEEAGHMVSSQQYTVEHAIDGWTIRGRIDAIIDNVLVDVKSTSSYGYKRYKDGITSSNDSFGYLEQLGFYREFIDTPVSKTEAGFVWIDKQNGHITYTPAITPTREDLEQRARSIIQAVDKSEQNVARYYLPEAYGKSGNRVLPMACSYCPYKDHCWRDSNNGKGLRTFAYNQGPVFFTDVVLEPRVFEVTK